MKIKLSRIEIDSLGPISNLNEDLGDVTLFYGLNETGKTFLVEFILKSLFNNLAGFDKNSFRVDKQNGRLLVSGLEDQPIPFSPNSRNKLEARWDDLNQGMPPNIARLLVVKGGELKIDRNASGGIGLAAIREFLSSQKMFDNVQKEISKTVRDSEITGQEISGPNRGEIKNNNTAKEDLEGINNLLDEVNHEVSSADIISLEKEILNYTEQLSNLDLAKKHLAYNLNLEIQQTQSEIKKFEDADFKELKNIFRDTKKSEEAIAKKEVDYEEKEIEGKHSSWLNEAVEEYQRLIIGKSSPDGISTLLILTIVSLAAALILSFINQSSLAAISIIFAIGLGYAYVHKIKSGGVGINEINQIKSSFKDKFGKPLKDFPTLKKMQKEASAAYHAGEQIRKDIENSRKTINENQFNLKDGLRKLSEKEVPTKQFEDIFARLEKEFDELTDQTLIKNKDLASLTIEPHHYEKNDPGFEFNQDEFKQIEEDLERSKTNKSELENAMQNIKSKIQGALNDSSLTSWEELIQKLRDKKLEILAESKSLTAKILAGILLNNVIEQSRKEEDAKIFDSLNSSDLKKPFSQISEKYVGIEIEDEQVKVIDQEDQAFLFQDLSTGAKEQLLLALRIGFATKVMQGDSAFIILDDAFQHTDWERRPKLIDAILELANTGWQIIYFSMDDHLRDLIRKKAKKIFKGNFVEINL